MSILYVMKYKIDILWYLTVKYLKFPVAEIRDLVAETFSLTKNSLSFAAVWHHTINLIMYVGHAVVIFKSTAKISRLLSNSLETKLLVIAINMIVPGYLVLRNIVSVCCVYVLFVYASILFLWLFYFAGFRIARVSPPWYAYWRFSFHLGSVYVHVHVWPSMYASNYDHESLIEMVMILVLLHYSVCFQPYSFLNQ